MIPEPLFILTLPRSFGSLVGAMLGQHPQLYGLPETHLFNCATVGEWCRRSSSASFDMSDGLARVVAQLFFGVQDESSILEARAWLMRRADFTSGFLLETLAERVSPRALVEKSPSLVYDVQAMERAHSMFPRARFMHLVQHPRGYCEAVIAGILAAAAHGAVPAWMLELASYPDPPAGSAESLLATHGLDPQRAWHTLNTNVRHFLESVAPSRRMLVRAEELLAEPARVLLEVADWLGVSSGADELERMLHPEHSPYARLGPPNARYGDDYDFLANPGFTALPRAPQSLAGELSWRGPDSRFAAEVQDLARSLEYD